jgi:hypothetical protein
MFRKYSLSTFLSMVFPLECTFIVLDRYQVDLNQSIFPVNGK